MSVTDTLKILKSAKEEKKGIGAFNVVSLTQMIAAKEVAEELKYPLLVQTSVATASFYTPEIVVNAFKSVMGKIDVPVALHLDHCRDIDFAKRCAIAGYNSVMVDFSKEPYETNINKTSEVVKFCKELGNIRVEGELGIIPGVEDEIKISQKEELLCTPEAAYEFVRETGIDLFAPAIGTAHGIYKTSNPKIDYIRLRNIDEYLKSKGIFIPLVVHGCSGLTKDTIKKLIASGANKFNVSTNIKQKVLKGIRSYLDSNNQSNNTLELEKISRREAFKEIKKWVSIFVEYVV